MNYRIEGFDYLRAIMSIFVVIWHMDGGGRSLIFSKDEYLEHIFTVSDFVNFHLLLLAVPTFIFISIFLYATKPISNTRFKKSVVRISILLTFWPIAWILYKGGSQGLVAIIPNSPVDFFYMVLLAGNTIYYFFSSLIICLFISHLFLLLNQRVQISLLLFYIVLLTFLPELTKLTGFYPLSAYWSPLNFLALTFAAVLTAKNKDTIILNRKALLVVSIFLCTILSILEWKYSVGEIFFPGQGYAIPAYTRTSLLFAVFAIIIIALDTRIRSSGLIKYMAKYSLALYCLHPFLMGPAKKIVALFVQNETVALYASIMLVIISSYAIAMLLRKYYLKEEVIV